MGALFNFDFEIDQTLTERVTRLTIFSSDNDSRGVQDSVLLLQNLLTVATTKAFHHYGHFTASSMKTEEFPELLAEALRTD